MTVLWVSLLSLVIGFVSAAAWSDRHYAPKIDELNRLARQKERLRDEMEGKYCELVNEMDWIESGPGVKKVDGGWVCRFYPLNVQPVWPTLREAIRYGRESE